MVRDVVVPGLPSRPQNTPVLSGVNHGRAWRSRMLFNLILSSPLNQYLYGSDLISTCLKGDISRNEDPHFRQGTLFCLCQKSTLAGEAFFS
ncbi:hypothetical protein TNCV_1058701 [Trichonephila clavipes]|nr:hypothetical protein TNCV_1058701 [Trichonephila clavipes]